MSALSERAIVAPSKAQKVLYALLMAAGDKDYYVRKVAARTLDSFSVQQLVQGYCSGVTSSEIVRRIMKQLYTQPLVVAPGRDAQHYRLTLHQSTGQPTQWEAPKQQIDWLKSAIKSECPGGRMCVIQ